MRSCLEDDEKNSINFLCTSYSMHLFKCLRIKALFEKTFGQTKHVGNDWFVEECVNFQIPQTVVSPLFLRFPHFGILPPFTLTF